ncbi:hypothetical protein [Parachlamydia sp. AcF125]|nr:hypothetical protein [Parachlamydia sp. AcF125]MBS4167993.1 hypothetical protein [Parachlamydia sp. AcF125]
MNLVKFNQTCNQLETFFHVSECIPFLGATTSAMRANWEVCK